MKQTTMRSFALLITLTFLAAPLQAQEFVAVKVEAENYISKHFDWHRTSNSSTPNVRPDPDGSHAASASGGAYMELLPDTRVTHSDSLITNTNFWNVAGTGPSLSYNVNIPEPGRYIVFAKAYSTGTEDNGIHVGLNNSNPASGERMQWCNGKNQWTWSSAQRTNSNHCGTQRTIFLDFNFAGSNTITFSAREDGFELDQFILLKTDNSSCTPNNNDQIVCNTGTTSVSAQAAPSGNAIADQTTGNTTPATQPPTTASTTLPACASADSDPDGDGFGWENNQSCLVTGASGTAASTTTNQTSGQTSGLPVCLSDDSDPDGDGFGWENNQSCQVTDSSRNGTQSGGASQLPACLSDDSDPDGDGFGWEQERSCRVQ